MISEEAGPHYYSNQRSVERRPDGLYCVVGWERPQKAPPADFRPMVEALNAIGVAWRKSAQRSARILAEARKPPEQRRAEEFVRNVKPATRRD